MIWVKLIFPQRNRSMILIFVAPFRISHSSAGTLQTEATRYHSRYRVVPIRKERMDNYAFGILFSSALI